MECSKFNQCIWEQNEVTILLIRKRFSQLLEFWLNMIKNYISFQIRKDIFWLFFCWLIAPITYLTISKKLWHRSLVKLAKGGTKDVSFKTRNCLRPSTLCCQAKKLRIEWKSKRNPLRDEHFESCGEFCTFTVAVSSQTDLGVIYHPLLLT